MKPPNNPDHLTLTQLHAFASLLRSELIVIPRDTQSYRNHATLLQRIEQHIASRKRSPSCNPSP